MKRFRTHTGVSLALALGAAVALGVLGLLSGRSVAGAAQELTVCPEGPPRCNYATIQEAVNAVSDGDVIKIAGGIYTDVHGRSAPIGYPAPPADGIIRQLVYIDKSVTLRGGYSTDFGDPPDPQAHPTTLDAQGGGRVLCIIGSIRPTIEGLRLTGGDAAGLGGSVWGGDAGGGVYVQSAAVTISNSEILNNSAANGSGLYLLESDATLTGNGIVSNTADNGGGLLLYQSDATLSDNIVLSNSANYGGGLYLTESDATLKGNTIASNSTMSQGGGLYLSQSSTDATLSGNTVTSNTARFGGGLSLHRSAAILQGNRIAANSATFWGGGLFLYYSDAALNGNSIASNSADLWGGGLFLYASAATLNGSTIISNSADWKGGGLMLWRSDATIGGNTIASNNVQQGDGGGLFLESSGATLSSNDVLSNSADFGGGLFVAASDATLDGNTIAFNSARWGDGGGLFLSDSDATLTNNVVADNWANTTGSGLCVAGGAPRLLHTTIARNRVGPPTPGGGEGSGIFVTGCQACVPPGWVKLTNSILVSHSVGISVTAGNTATLAGTLWGSGVWANEVDWSGAGTVSAGPPNAREVPGFVDPNGGDYGIDPGSAAIDAGVEAGIRTDVDGQPRPYGAPDLGADEYWPPGELQYVYLPEMLRGLR